MLEQACADAERWQREHPDALVNVNLSSAELGPGLVNRVLGTLERTGLTPGGLCIEVTESVLLADLGAAVEWLHHLRDAGVKIALDDFGTGYSSLSYVAHLPLDFLKIDRSFLVDLCTDGPRTAAAEAVMSAILTLCGSLELRTVVEGIETADQLERVRSLGVELVQGYFFAQPVPAEELPSVLTSLAGRGDTPHRRAA